MSNTIHQHGQGDNFVGDKIMGDKVMGDKKQNDFQRATIGFVAQDQAQATVSNLNQTNGANVAELMQIISTMRQTAAQFPPDIHEDITINIDDLKTEIQKSEKEPNLPRLKNRLTALLTAATVTFAGVAGMADFANNVMEIGNKLNIELPLPSGK